MAKAKQSEKPSDVDESFLSADELVKVISDYHLKRYKHTEIDIKHPGGRPAFDLIQELIHECGQVRMFMLMGPCEFVCRIDHYPYDERKLRFIGFSGGGIDGAIAQCFAKFAKAWLSEHA